MSTPTPRDAPRPATYSSFECHYCDRTIADTDLRIAFDKGSCRFCSADCARKYAVDLRDFADDIERAVARPPWDTYEVPDDWRLPRLGITRCSR